MGEGGIYAPYHAALAIKQSQGDPLEAAFFLRAYRSTLTRLPDSLPIDTARMRLTRRISSAFKSIPGGQILGDTPDYTQRILDFSLDGERSEDTARIVRDFEDRIVSEKDELKDAAFTKVVQILQLQGLAPEAEQIEDEPAVDVTKDSILYPMHRSGRLQMMARGETGGLLAIAYSSMRGLGSIHPTIAELRVGKVRVEIPHPYRKGVRITLGWIQITEAEIVAKLKRSEKKGDKPKFTLGYGVCFGHNEVKAISMGTLDNTLKAEEPAAPAQDQEFVLYHTDGIESSGFCSHFKLPHYITFQSALDRLRESQRRSESPELVRQGRSRD
jgi:alpha-D-ribose 1-methylphosphonate 5-triphosphate synthase subunit PhnI